MRLEKIILTIFLILLVNLVSFSQTDKKTIKIGSCDYGIERALKDAQNKKYKSYSYGMVVRTEEQWKFEKFYKDYMKSKYNILIVDGGCVITSESKCYSNKMDKLIKTKFGADVFFESRKEAKKEYDKRN